MKKRFFSLISVVLAAAVVFGGCGENDADDSSSAVSSAETTSAQTEAPAETSEAEESSEPETDEPEITDSVTDLFMAVNKDSVCIGEEDNEIIFVARDILIDAVVELVDADTGEVVGIMLDDADFPNSGDDIKGDAWYSLRYRVDVDFPTDPDVSEDRDYHYYARYIDGTTEHRSDVTEIFVYESFTDKELDEMETVDNSIQELMQSEGYEDLSIDEKREKMVALLEELEAEGLIDEGSIYPYGDNISFTYCGGVGSVVMLKSFDPMMN